MIIRINPESEFLRVVATGGFSLEDAKRTFLEVLDAIAEHGAEKVLIDGRELDGEPTTMQRFYYGEFAAQATVDFMKQGALSEVPKFAYVLEEPVLDPERFGETVAVNRGMRVKAFDNLEDALRWLGL